MSEEVDNPILSVVPNLVTCINNRINAEKFENRELLQALQLFLEYAAATPQQGTPQLPEAILLAAQQFNTPISRGSAYEVAKKISELIVDEYIKEAKK
jgi:hypothetical protein